MEPYKAKLLPISYVLDKETSDSIQEVKNLKEMLKYANEKDYMLKNSLLQYPITFFLYTW